MKIFFENINKKQFLINITDNITVEELKILIQDIDGIHPHLQNLYYNDILLLDFHLLCNYNIVENSIIYYKKYNYKIDSCKIKPIVFPKETIFNFL